MYSINLYCLQRACAEVQSFRQDGDFWAMSAALKLYQRVRKRGWLERVKARLAGSPAHLWDLAAVEDTCSVRGRRYAGTQAVPLTKIWGTEGRQRDFDAGFRPLRIEGKDRWVSIAVAWLMGVALPPVELIQVRDVYFVRDGHHRVSVARALGKVAIDADVVVWDVVGILPWERAVVPGSLVGQPA